MAINTIASFYNPLNSRTIGSSKTATGSTTVYTAVANDRVSSFSISYNVTGTAGTDMVLINLTIGSAQFVVKVNGAVAPGTSGMVTSDQLGYKGGFLQAGDTIVFATTDSGAPTYKAVVGIAVDNYTL